MLAQTHPHLESVFLYLCNRNGEAEKQIPFSRIKTGSNRYAMWRCPKTNCKNKCLHTYVARINSITCACPNGCPFCSGRKYCYCNSLEGRCPSIVQKYWDFQANGDLKPSDVSQNSHKKVHWKCPDTTCDHHKWQASVTNFAGQKQGCPFCSSPPKRFCECFCLFTEHSDLIEHEWDYQKNKDLDFWSLGPQSNKKAHWICRKCKFEWQATISNRTGTMQSNCPKCKVLKLERNMMIILEKLCEEKKITSFQHQWHIPNTKYIADFHVVTLDNTSIIIEMDGIQHFIPKSFGSKSKSKEEMFLAVQTSDCAKNEWCKKHNIPLLRLSYLVSKESYEKEILAFIAQKPVMFKLI